MIMEIVKTEKNGHLAYKVNEYVFVLLLFTSMNLYSAQYLGIHSLTSN